MKKTTKNWSPTSSRTSSAALTSLVVAFLLCAAPAPATTRGPTVTAALKALQDEGQITAAEYQQDRAVYGAATRTLKKLKGSRHSELGGVIANVRAIAAAGQFTPSRLPSLFLTLERNRVYWSTRPLLSYGQRVSFPGSLLVWQYYPGQGIEIQWLGTFGNANGYFLSGTNNANLRRLLGEVIPLATKRAGGIAWEYLFKFDGGNPPWVSGLAQGTALQALARGFQRLKEPAYLSAAQQALGIFQTPPPQGVQVKTATGSHYLQYSFAPKERILNGFVQSVVGLYDFASISKDPLGLKLFEAGDAEARVEVPRYDTGSWSLYDQREESALNYHQLLTEFLQNLCKRTQSKTTLSADPVADQIYCTTAQRFTDDLKTPPLLTLLTTKLRGGTRAGVHFTLSKVSNVSLSVTREGKTVWTNSARITYGTKQILWVTPGKAGLYTVKLRATDLAGNSTTTTGEITLSAPAKAHVGKSRA